MIIFVHCQRLIARKLAVLFGFNRGVRPFYAACCVNQLSRGSVLCLLNASFEKLFPQHHKSIFYGKIDDHGIGRGDTRQIITRLRHPVASRVVLDLPYWAIRSAPYHLIRTAIKTACKAGAFFSTIPKCTTAVKLLMSQKP